jgi:hypothetical protein
MGIVDKEDKPVVDWAVEDIGMVVFVGAVEDN